MSTSHDDDLLRAAFRDLHSIRLHGFALLVTLGDRRAAAGAARRALLGGARQVHELRHPERAAAWLRARALHSMTRFSLRRRPRPTEADRLAALRSMGVDGALLRALSTLSLRERAALVASSIERLDPADVQVVLGAGPAATERAMTSARGRYLAARAPTPSEHEDRSGPVSELVLRVAARTLSPTGGPR